MYDLEKFQDFLVDVSEEDFLNFSKEYSFLIFKFNELKHL